jgi:quinol monooxygenase YgiN
MILIVVKWKVKPEHADAWPELTKAFTEATRAEPGNRFFDWSRSLEHPNQYVLVEGFDDDAAGAHVQSDHFEQARADLPQYLLETPEIRNWQDQSQEWDRLGEFTV